VHVIRVRDGVEFARIAPAGFVILSAFHSATQVLHVDIWITCGTDSHAGGDPHPSGEAYDISVGAYSVDMVLELHTFLEKALGPLFTVLYESPRSPDDPRLRSIVWVNPGASAPHLHVQRKKGTIYPPPPPTARNV